DGIRDFHVTGVQTCALPILTPTVPPASRQTGRQRCLTPTGHAHSRISPDTPGVRHPKGVRHQPCHAPQPHQSGYFRCLTPKGCLTPTVPRPTATSVQILHASDTRRVSDTNRRAAHHHTIPDTSGV